METITKTTYSAAVQTAGDRQCPETDKLSRWVGVDRSPFPGAGIHGIKLSFASSVSAAQADQIRSILVDALNKHE